MSEKTSLKLLIFNIVMALLAVIGYLMHVTESVDLTVKFIFYPIYAYFFLSFVTASIGIVMAMLAYERGVAQSKKLALWHALYIVALLITIAVLWASHHPQAVS